MSTHRRMTLFIHVGASMLQGTPTIMFCRTPNRNCFLPHLGPSVVVGVVLLLLVPVLHAQRRNNFGPTLPVFIPAPREIQRELNIAADNIELEEYVDAITRLDYILNGGGERRDEDAGVDYFLPAQKGKPRVSIKQEASRLISTLPEKGRRAYELAYGTTAAQRLKQAVAERNYDTLVELSRRYGNTVAGEEATLLLGRKSLVEGNSVEAVLHFQRLSQNVHAAERFGDELTILHAAALKLSRRDAEAKQLLAGVNLPASSPLAANFDAAKPDSLLAAIPHSLLNVEELADWRIFGGNLQRTGSTNAGMPMRAFAWDLPNVLDPNEQKKISDYSKSLGAGATPAIHPLLVGDTVLARSADFLLGVPIQQGRRQWNYPSWETDSGSLSAARRDAMIKQRVWNNSLYGQVSSDGQYVFLISSISTGTRTRTTPAVASNELVALDLAGEGKLQWIVGSDDANHEPKLREMFFLGPPLPIGDSLFCVGERNGEIQVMELNKSNGKLLWSQQLAHVESNRFSRPDLRRLAGLNLAYSDGILVCPTSTGGAIAIELSQRRFMWGHEYKGRLNQVTRRPVPQNVVEHWRDNWVMIDQGRVILTPWDADEMFCLDLLTGQDLWRRKTPRKSGLYVAGVHNEQVIVVGKSDVVSLSMKDGKQNWKRSLRGSPSGRGLITGSHFMLATTESELLNIDLDSGEIVESMATIDPLGNLIASDEMIISQNALWLRAFYQRDKLEEKVARRLKENPKDPWALEHAGVLLLEDGKHSEGLAKLQEAIANYPLLNTPGLDYLAKKRLVDETFELLLEENGPESLELARQIKSFLPESRKQEYLRVMTVRNQKEGQLLEAFDSNLDLFFESLSKQSRLIVEPQMMEFPDRRIRADRWHRSMFMSLWQAANASQRTQMERQITKAIRDVQDDQREALLEVVKDLPTAHPAYLDLLATKMLNQRRPPYIEGSLLRLSKSENAEVAGRAVAYLAALYRSSGQMLAAASQYRRLRSDFADAVVNDQQTGAEIAAAAVDENATLRSYLANDGSQEEWGYGVVTATKKETDGSAARPANIYGYTRASNTLNGFVPVGTEHGPELVDGIQWAFSQGVRGMGLILESRDPMGQTVASLGTMFRSSRLSREPKVRTFGHLVVGAFANNLVVLNGLRDGTETTSAELWRDSEPPALGNANSPVRPLQFGQLGISRQIETGPGGLSRLSLGCVSDRGVIVRRSGDLICFDPASGEKLWQRDDLRVEAEVWGDDELVFAHVDDKFPNGGGNARVFSAMDGTELESRPCPNQGNRVRTFGRYVLAWKKDLGQSLDLNLDPNQVVEDILKADDPELKRGAQPKLEFTNQFELRDLFNRAKRFEWSRSYSDLARAHWLGHKTLALFDPADGKLEVISVMDGKSLLSTKVKTDLQRIDSMIVEKKEGLYLLTIGMKSDGKVNQEMRYKSPIAIKSLENLEVHAFSPDGESIWGVPAKLSNFRPLPIHSRGLPIMIFSRKNESNANRAKRTFETVVLDVRDGHVAFTHSDLFLGSSQFQVLGHRGEGKIDLTLPSKDGNWTLGFTDEPRAPAVPYGYATNQSPNRKKNPVRRLYGHRLS